MEKKNLNDPVQRGSCFNLLTTLNRVPVPPIGPVQRGFYKQAEIDQPGSGARYCCISCNNTKFTLVHFFFLEHLFQCEYLHCQWSSICIVATTTINTPPRCIWRKFYKAKHFDVPWYSKNYVVTTLHRLCRP